MKTLWSIRNLSQNTQKIYSRNLRRLCRKTNMNDPVKIEFYVFGLDVTNKLRNTLFNSYSHYCRANEIHWDRPRIKTEVYPVKVPTARACS